MQQDEKQDSATVQLTDDATIVIANEQIIELMPSYRKLKAEHALIQAKMDEMKEQIEPLVEAVGGKWQDALGYARQNTRSDSVSYKSAEVDALVQAWLISKESIIQTCGEMLNNHRSEKKGFTYLQLK